jgi:hypothetical protein
MEEVLATLSTPKDHQACYWGSHRNSSRVPIKNSCVYIIQIELYMIEKGQQLLVHFFCLNQFVVSEKEEEKNQRQRLRRLYFLVAEEVAK